VLIVLKADAIPLSNKKFLTRTAARAQYACADSRCCGPPVRAHAQFWPPPASAHFHF
jgi:hypothetical protein